MRLPRRKGREDENVQQNYFIDPVRQILTFTAAKQRGKVRTKQRVGRRGPLNQTCDKVALNRRMFVRFNVLQVMTQQIFQRVAVIGAEVVVEASVRRTSGGAVVTSASVSC